MNPTYLLAIDNGTQSVRALLFDLQGALVDKAQVMIETYQSPQPGWMENAPDAFWQSMCQACKQLWATSRVPRSAIAGVVVTTQRGSTIALDEDGQALRPAMIWLDQRRADRLPPLAWWWDAAFRAIGMRETVRFFQQEAEANWIAQHQPDIWARTAKYLLLSGYLNYRLTGRFVDSVASQVGYIPFDYRHGCWAAKGDWKWQALAVRPAMLPELATAGSVIGQVSAAAAHDSGIPQGLPVLAGAADKACEVLGAGCLTPEIACLSYGTAATVNTTTPRYLETTRFIPPYQAAVPGHYNTEVQITRGFWMVNWFKEQFGLHEQQIARERGVTPESLFDALVDDVPPGALGLMLQPFWSPGVKVPGPEARGAVIGLARCTRAPTCTAPSSKDWRTGCARARNGSSTAAARRSRGCACPAAARRATRRCRSRPTCSTCPPSGPTCTRPAAWAPRSWGRWDWACTRTSAARWRR